MQIKYLRCGRRPLPWLIVLLVLAAMISAAEASASVQSEIAFHRGVVAYGNGEFDEAQAAFETVLGVDAEDTSAIHYLGLIAMERGEPAQAIELYRRALAIDPDDTDLHFDLGAALLESGDTAEARTAFNRVLAEEPDRARAQLFAGIAAYRAGAYQQALPHLNRADSLDPTLNAQARYYTGLCHANLQDFPAAAAAFSQTEQSPLSPLAESARNLERQVSDADQESRTWSLALTAGIEYDSNPTIAGKPLNRDDDVRGVYRINARKTLFEHGRYSATVGYDGYLSTHTDATIVDLMTHVASLSLSADFDPVRLGLRYDYAYTWIDALNLKKFRELHRITPSVSVRNGDWGWSQVYYQANLQEFKRDLDAASLNPTNSGYFVRDGERHVVGVNQYFFPGERLPDYLGVNYFRIGALADLRDTDGKEWRYDSWEVALGVGMSLPWELEWTLLYRLTNRDFREDSIIEMGLVPPAPPSKRNDLQNRLNCELSRAIGEHWQASTAGYFTFNDSDVGFYDYNRAVIGVYLSYRF